jgi:hypothetical protein
MKPNILITIIVLIFIQSAVARESKNCPKESEASNIVKNTGGKHSKIESIEKRDSHKTADSYLHMFSGKLGDGHCVLIFDNKKKYLGYYNTGIYVPAGYDSSKRVLWLFAPGNERHYIRLGNRGPWKTVGFVESFTPSFTIGDKFTFNETKDYLEQTVSTDMRQWVYIYGHVKTEIGFRGKLVDATDNWSFLQQQDGTVFCVARDLLSHADRKFIRTALKNIEK